MSKMNQVDVQLEERCDVRLHQVEVAGAWTWSCLGFIVCLAPGVWRLAFIMRHPGLTPTSISTSRCINLKSVATSTWSWRYFNLRSNLMQSNITSPFKLNINLIHFWHQVWSWIWMAPLTLEVDTFWRKPPQRHLTEIMRYGKIRTYCNR